MPANRSAEFTQISDRIVEVLRRRVGKDERAAKPHDWYTAAVYTLRDAVIDQWMDSTRRTYETKGKRVYYLSLEFLIGRLLRTTRSAPGRCRRWAAAARTAPARWPAPASGPGDCPRWTGW